VLFPIDYIYLGSPNRKWYVEIVFLYTHRLFTTTVEVPLLTVKLDGRIGQFHVPTTLFLEKEPLEPVRLEAGWSPDFPVIQPLPVTILTGL
jgi:hypothetical protein